MMTLFNDSELSRILKDDGILIVKIMDMIESGKPVWNHMLLPQKLKSFDLEDPLIYSFRGVYDPKWGRMMHSRKCHAYFMIFKKADIKWAKRFEGVRA